MSTDPRLIDAAPTKDFFIHMLVRDIELIPAIGDLVDNSVDGARRIRKDGNYSGLVVRISANDTEFRIEDNCGGIDIETAKRYAFRFGRPPEATGVAHSIGQFGVGMKRALFKLGSAFTVRSSTAEEAFTVEVDVTEWQQSDEWQFRFSDIDEPDRAQEPGTSIVVNRLHDTTAESFRQSSFLTRLARTIGLTHQQAMSAGLVVTVNGAPTGGGALELLASDRLTPGTTSLHLYEDSEAPVTIRLYAGVVTASSPSDAGWYVYCNGRLVTGADKSSMTGWGTGSGTQLPLFHNRYARFRGYAFFDCDDASKLPWTTTKTGLDADAPVYARALQAMILLARPVLTFLSEIAREIEQPPEAGEELEQLIASARLTTLPPGNGSHPFSFARPRPKPKPPTPEPTQSIQYRKPVEQIEAVKRALGVASAGEAGQRTFDYFYKVELGED